jgi:outer membrane protein assembly factor BamB
MLTARKFFRQVVLVTGTIVLGCGLWSAHAADTERRLPTSQQLAPFGMELAWTAQTVLNPSRDVVSHLMLDEETLYVQSSNGVVAALDPETGRRRWAQRLGRFDEPTYPPVSNDDMVLVVIGTNMYGLNRDSGELMWTLRLPGAASTGPSIDANHVYVGTLDGSVYAFSLSRIRELYLEQRLPQWSIDTLVWRHRAAQEITSPPISDGLRVNFASRDGSLYSVSAARHELNFQFETDAAISAPMAELGGLQYLASEDSTFYAIDSRNGRVKWEFVTGLPIRTAPVAVGDRLYLTPERGGMYCLDRATGSYSRSCTDDETAKGWWQPRATAFVGVAQDMVFARDKLHNLLVLGLKCGDVRGQLWLNNFPRHVTNDRTDRIYLASKQGQILALRVRGSGYPTFHRYPDRRPILPELAPEDDEATTPATEDSGAAQ